MYKHLVDERKCHVLSPAGWSFSRFAWPFKFPKCSSMDKNHMNLSSNVEGPKKSDFLKNRFPYMHTNVITQFVSVSTTLHLYTH